MMDPQRLRDLAKFPSSIVADALDGKGVLPSSIGAVCVNSRMAGVAYTVDLPLGDNLGLHVAIARAAELSVIVACVPSAEEYGIWGAISSTAASQRGLAGFVTNGFVRDREQLAQIGLAVFAAGISLRRTAKQNPGRHAVPVEIGGVAVLPGDFVIGDSDGVVVVPRGDVDAITERAEDLVRKEESILQGLHEGRSTLQLLNLPDVVS